jgi:hypothetical protein
MGYMLLGCGPYGLEKIGESCSTKGEGQAWRRGSNRTETEPEQRLLLSSVFFFL